MSHILGVDTAITLVAAGAIFLLALALGVWKYRQVMVSDGHRAHVYVDIAHRAALLYAFATLLVAVFVELSVWPAWLNLTAAMVRCSFSSLRSRHTSSTARVVTPRISSILLCRGPACSWSR
ncbi:hypothetical protein I551_8819 [Mycobacterium ulcerans str. Harvey]|uniref:Integral membrane protein n=1 Tax=Mycobacterium ulcerans str. Harvey TaxID=1299332 RepID=A0ABP3AS98_MYCUL|nr:hypothetical protein I551_8819 [Mycobacterium ulcerans str. Harvey]